MLVTLPYLKLFSQNITIDSSFGYKEIYNALTAQNINTKQPKDFSLNIKNISGAKKQLYISIINPNIDKIVITKNKEVTILGDSILFSNRIFKHYNHVYTFSLENDSTTTVNIKVYNPFQHALNFRLIIANENEFIKTTNHDYFFNGLFYGVFFMFLLLLIGMYIFSKSKFFIIYCAINCFILLLFMQYNGTGYQFIWFYSAFVQKHISIIAAVGYLTIHLLFIRAFFAYQIKNLSKYIFNTILVVLALSVGLYLLKSNPKTARYVQDIYYYIIVNGIYALYGCLLIALCVYSYFETKRIEILWVLIGVLINMLNWIVFINNEFITIHWLNFLDNIKLFNSNIFVPQINYGIFLFEIFIVTSFIIYNYHAIIIQNNNTELQLEQLYKKNINTYILGQEEERLKITKQIDDLLSKDIRILKNEITFFKPEYDPKNIIPNVVSELDTILTDIKNVTENHITPDMQYITFKTLIQSATDKLNSVIPIQYMFNKINDEFCLSPIANINIYRIFQEISNNAIKHSCATAITIIATKDSQTMQIKITDNGVGFDNAKEKNKGIGLMNIESRLQSLNGNFYTQSNVNNGTTIQLIMNLKDIC